MTWAGIILFTIGLVVFLSSFDAPVFDRQPEKEPDPYESITVTTDERPLLPDVTRIPTKTTRW